LDDLTVVIPVRNAESQVDACLTALAAERPAEIIVVDGCSTDGTVGRALAHGARLLSDEGRGLPAARMLGIEAAATRYVALVDADVVIAAGDLAALLDELRTEDYDALQAGLESTGGPGYWGRALAFHHRTGRSRRWFGVVATVCEREVLLTHGFDTGFSSGEDIDLRWRLRAAGCKIGVSTRTVVEHRFEDGFRFARGQWAADGAGLARMLRRHGIRAKLLAALPLAAAVRGTLLCVWQGEPRWIPYYLSYMVGNYLAMLRELARP
jgi:glycosyltransferase involved in cell wall biosynthesis